MFYALPKESQGSEEASRGLPRAARGESVDVVTFVVTRPGLSSLLEDLGWRQHERGNLRILSRLVWKGVQEMPAAANIVWRGMPRLHAKAVIYRGQQFAWVGSFNLTKSSLRDNDEFAVRIDGSAYEDLCKWFDSKWLTAQTGGPTIIEPNYEGEPEENADAARTHELSLPLALQVERIGRGSLWSFQREIIGELLRWEDKRQKAKPTVVKLPTGAGKTVVAAEFIAELIARRPGARVLWVCHRVTLVSQALCRVLAQVQASTTWYAAPSVHADLRSFDSSLAPCGDWARADAASLVFSTLDSAHHLSSCNGRFDLVIVDECHHYHLETKRCKSLETARQKWGSLLLGLSYTPPSQTVSHADRWRRFAKVWAPSGKLRLLGERYTREALTPKYLAEYNGEHWDVGFRFEISNPSHGPEQELTARVGSFNHPDVNSSFVDALRTYGGGLKRTLAFAVTIEHADDLVSAATSANLSCEVRAFHSRLSARTRAENLQWFRAPLASGEPGRVLTSVLMLTEGIDVPAIDSLFMIRPTFSRALYHQMLGRGARGSSVSGGSGHCFVLDFTYQFVSPSGAIEACSLGSANSEPTAVGGVVEDESENETEGIERVVARHKSSRSVDVSETRKSSADPFQPHTPPRGWVALLHHLPLPATSVDILRASTLRGFFEDDEAIAAIEAISGVSSSELRTRLKSTASTLNKRLDNALREAELPDTAERFMRAFDSARYIPKTSCSRAIGEKDIAKPVAVCLNKRKREVKEMIKSVHGLTQLKTVWPELEDSDVFWRLVVAVERRQNG